MQGLRRLIKYLTKLICSFCFTPLLRFGTKPNGFFPTIFPELCHELFTLKRTLVTNFYILLKELNYINRLLFDLGQNLAVFSQRFSLQGESPQGEPYVVSRAIYSQANARDKFLYSS